MTAIKIRVAEGLKMFGLHPGSEVRTLERELEKTRASLEEKDRQLRARLEHLETARKRLRERNDQVADLRGRLGEKAGDRAANRGEVKESVWHRQAVGGMWDEVGRMQLDFLRERGLKPHHHLLDVGCGSLRGGVRLIPYLEPGHYHGVDRSQRLLSAGREELLAAGLQDREPVLTRMDDFGFERLGQVFDFALAQSLFSHLPLNVIARCLVNADRVLRPGGVFYATFFENRRGRTYLEPLEQGDGFFSYYDADPFHYTRDALEWACGETGLTPEYVGDWGHPRNQMMMAFRKEPAGSPGT